MVVSIGAVKFDVRDVVDVWGNGVLYRIELKSGDMVPLTIEQWMWLDVAREAM